MPPHSQKTVLITGCSEGGTGEALAREFHGHGLRVFATARTPEKMRGLGDRGVEVLALDVADAAAVQRTVAAVARPTGGTLDLLVNNAGVGCQVPLPEACAPLAAPPRRIVNIGSVASRVPIPWSGVYYNASKAALGLLSDTLRVELAPLGVEVLHVVTGGSPAGAPEPNDTSTATTPASLHGPARAVIRADLAGATYRRKQTMSAERYARRPSKTLWLGGLAPLYWLGSRFGWATLLDWIITNFLGWSFRELKAKLRSARPRKSE
ncbi:putative short-chain dehydrogenase/reductase [Xylariomycetidae sp. FL0641]|nr:putative short-chain dehydrogenase/reductase [Xylariomycetidae sp. FL0641]